MISGGMEVNMIELGGIELIRLQLLNRRIGI